MERGRKRRALREVETVLDASSVGTGLSREVALALRTAGATGRLDGLVGPAYALGTLRAQEGHAPLALVDEIVRMRRALPGDLVAATDEVLRHAVAAYHDEAIRVLGAVATRDALTGLANRLVFEDAVERAVARTTPPGPTLLVFDLDNFKTLNDVRGHLAGDGALVAFAETLRACVRPGDVPARLGGDEFVALLPDSGATAGAEVAARVVARLLKRVEARDPRAPLGVSAGVAGWRDGDDAATLLQRADEAMYAAKSAGGGRAVVAGDAVAGDVAAPVPAVAARRRFRR